MSEYQALTAAGRTLSAIKCEIANEDGAYTSAAWKMLYHAEQYVTKLADQELRQPHIPCYKKSEAECDLEVHKCFNCGNIVCFSHSHHHETEGTFCDACVAVN